MDVRTQLLNTAQDLIQRNGVDSFSFRTLAEKVNIKSASVHYHFPKKEDLLVEIAKKYSAEFFEELKKINAADISSKKKLIRLLSIFEDTQKNKKICFCAMLASVSENLSGESVKELEFFFEDLSSWILDVFKQAKKREELQSELSVKTLTNLIVASFEGALLIDSVSSDHKYLKSCRELVADILV